jgi:hypothetical protein
MNDYLVYPNVRGRVRGDADTRGVLRNGMVDENQDMQAKELAGLPAYVTHEAEGRVWFYVFQFVNAVPFYSGPFVANAEEILER